MWSRLATPSHKPSTARGPFSPLGSQEMGEEAEEVTRRGRRHVTLAIVEDDMMREGEKEGIALLNIYFFLYRECRAGALELERLIY